MPDNKTAMQELIELLDREIESNFTRDAPVMTQRNQQPYKRIKSRAIKLLEKEKQHIIDAYHINPKESVHGNIGVDYYNQNFKK